MAASYLQDIGSADGGMQDSTGPLTRRTSKGIVIELEKGNP